MTVDFPAARIVISGPVDPAVLRPFLGRPYRAGADGPDAFDCYGLVRSAGAAAYGLRLPGRNEALAIGRRAWARLPGAADGALVFMGGPHGRHVGLYCVVGPTGGVLHCEESIGTVFDDVLTLGLRGFRRLRFFAAR